jgi:hypothetical protein
MPLLFFFLHEISVRDYSGFKALRASFFFRLT